MHYEILRKQRILSHLLKKSLMENFIFCSKDSISQFSIYDQSSCHISNNQLICTVRGSRSRCSAEKVFSENSQNLHESTCARVSFLIKLRSPEACKFIKKETLAQVFSCKFCEIPKIWEHLFLQNTSGGCFYTVNQLNVRYITGSLALKVL